MFLKRRIQQRGMIEKGVSPKRKDLLMEEELRKLKDEIAERRQAQEVLQESEARLRIILDTAKEGIIFSDERGYFEVYNSGMERLTGYSKEEASSAGDFTALLYPNPKDVHQARERLGILARENREQEFESVIQRKDGQLRHVLIYSTVVPYRNRKMFLSTFYDITERKKAEDRLRESESKFRSLFESSRDATMTLDPSAGKFTSGNRAALEMFGVKDEQEFITLRPWDLSPERQLDGRASGEKAKEMIQTAIREGFYFFEWTHRRMSGEDFPATVLLTRIEQSGKIIIQATVRDITAQKRAEKKLEDILRQQKAILDNIPDIAWLKDSELRFIAVNEAFGRTCNLRPEQLIGKNDFDIWPKEIAERYRLNDREATESGKRKQIEEPLIDKEGHVRWLETVRTPIFDEIGRVVGTAGIARDITERKKMEDNIKKGIEDLQQFKDLTINREEKMIELKKEINHLSKELGRSEPYDLSFLNENPGDK